MASTEEASDMTDGIDGFEMDIDTADPKSEVLETIAGGSRALLLVGLVS